MKSFNLQDVPLYGTMLLEASAGTGKTYALENLVARFVGRDNDPLNIENILVVTFTIRAAREMRERIRRLLGRYAEDSSREINERMRYRKALSHFDSAAIYTIHGFCRNVLATWPFESSAPFQQELMPGNALENEEIRRWLASDEALSMDTAILHSAYRYYGGSDGLVRAICQRLIDEGVPPGSTLLPTSQELENFKKFMEECQIPDGPLSKVRSQIFDFQWSDDAMKSVFTASNGPKKKAESLNKIRNHIVACSESSTALVFLAALFGDPSKTEVRTHFTDLLFAASCVEPQEVEHEEGRRLATGLHRLIELLYPYIDFNAESRSSKVISLLDRYMQCVCVDSACRAVEKHIANVKNRNGIWGYSDLIRGVANAVNKPENALSTLLKTRYRAVLIDEFQDTDPSQWELFYSVFHAPNNLLVLIGDPKQSIYGFRGTGLQAYASAKALVPESHRFRLGTNYRSRPELVDAINCLFAPIFARCSGGAAPVGFSPVRAAGPSDRALIWPHGHIPIGLIPSENETQSVEMTAAEIRRILDTSEGAHWQDGTPVAASDIAVLVRSERLENAIIEQLSSLGIASIRYRTRSIFHQPLVKTVIHLLSAIESPRNIGLWKTVLLGELFQVPPEVLLCFEKSGYLDILMEKGFELQRLFSSGRATEVFETFFAFAPSLGKWAAAEGHKAVSHRLSTAWPARILSQPDGLRQWQDWQHLTERIQQKQSEGACDILSILNWMHRSAMSKIVEGTQDAVRLETEEPAVRVMTMHAAKGLEFPLVFLLGGYNGKTKRSYKHPYRFDANGTLVFDRLCREAHFDFHRSYAWEEDKRLWYVAFTRAIYKVWVPLPTGDGKLTSLDSLWAISLSENGEDTLPAHEKFANKEASDFRQKIATQMIPFNGKFFHQVAFSQPPPLRPQVAPPGSTMALPPSHTGMRDPVTTSYTSLVHQMGSPGYFRIGEPDKHVADSGPIMDVLSQGHGPLFGILVHACLESVDFKQALCDAATWFNDASLDLLLKTLSNQFFPSIWYRKNSMELKKLIRTALRVTIPGLGRLCDLPPQALRSEVDFQISVPQYSEIHVDSGFVKVPQGFLKGFIDLLVQHNGQWWVIDWKSNLPHNAAALSSWSVSELQQVMTHHHYGLQYELYLIALCCTLSANMGRPVVWENEIGGAAYLFLRGLQENEKDGIFVDKPQLERIKAMANAMGHGEIIA